MKQLALFAALGFGLVACAPSLADQAKANYVIEEGSPTTLQGADFSGKTYPVFSHQTTKAGSCRQYAARYAEVGNKIFPVPIEEMGLWSYLVPLDKSADSLQMLLTSKNNGAITPNLYIRVSCEQQGALALLKVSSTGPLPEPRLETLNKTLLQRL